MSIDISLRVPTRRRDELSAEELSAEDASLDAGVCIPNLFGAHVHVGAPLHGEGAVPVFKLEIDHWVRYEISTADAAWLMAQLPTKPREECQ